ncbi:MAG: 4a-hydroxytetrahydrobiopterin dehydratase [Lentimonas sp.]|jgi:4a-hydroxytetrahydrobiopterin dehydratase
MLKKLSKQELVHKLQDIAHWSILGEDKWLNRKFKFKDWKETLNFINKVSVIAEDMNHHPDVSFSYGWCNIRIKTHDIEALSELDFKLAVEINKIINTLKIPG